MKSVVVVGAQWGDEGKGKVVDYLAGSFDYIARVAGGHNAGHTVIIGKDRYVLQLIPCGILRPKQHAVIGTGTVVDPAANESFRKRYGLTQSCFCRRRQFIKEWCVDQSWCNCIHSDPKLSKFTGCR